MGLAVKPLRGAIKMALTLTLAVTPSAGLFQLAVAV